VTDDDDGKFSPPAGAQAVVDGVAEGPVLPPVKFEAGSP